MEKKVIGIIGCGNMGEVILARNLRQKKYSFIIFEKDKAKQSRLMRAHHLRPAQSIVDLARKADIIIIALKPQDMDLALNEISKGAMLYKKKDILLISIAAGIRTEYIENTISAKVKVVRAMPNMPARIGSGITALVKGRFSGPKDLKTAQMIFGCLGEVVLLPKEELIDAVTALSGSGPAYLFFILSAFLSTAEELGLDRNCANKLVYHTVLGSINLLAENKFAAEDLISQVASKGGTTEAALNVFKERNIKEIIREAMISAYKRAEELSR